MTTPTPVPLPAPSPEEGLLMACRSRLIELLYQADAVRDEVVALLRAVDARLREVRRRDST